MNSEDLETSPISEKSLQRMPKYIHYLRRLQKEGIDTISASAMADELKIHHTQVRKDIAMTGIIGTPRVGHDVSTVLTAMEHFLNWDNIQDAFLVGVGNLGRALIKYQGFQRSGIKIIAAFDTDEAKFGELVDEVEILDIKKFKNLAKRMHTPIGIITTPAQKAQEVADLMVESGIVAIWNFAPIYIHVPQEIIIENAEIYSSLAVLSRKLKNLHNYQKIEEKEDESEE